jgi:hydroxymethylglutaryl-CoA lyase
MAHPTPSTLPPGATRPPADLPRRVKLVEVGPRDGLQNEKVDVPTEVRIELCDRLSDAGFPNVEAGSFVSPKWVPKMADTAELMARIKRRPGTIYSVLTPNLKGFEGALAAKADEVVVFGAATEAFAQKNINCSIAESIARFEPVARAAKDHGILLRGSLSVALGCPYQGDVPPSAVADVVRRLADLGCDEIDIADTIGVATPAKTRAALEAAASVFPIERLSGHFHDTYGQAVGNIYASLEVGISIFHSSVAGLGGCPYAKGATGNVATEDVVYLLDGLGIETGVDLAKVVETGQWISAHLGRRSESRAGNALAARRAAIAA